MQVEAHCVAAGAQQNQAMYKDMSLRLQGEQEKGSVEHKRNVLRFYTQDARQDHPLFSYMAGTFRPTLTKSCTCAQYLVSNSTSVALSRFSAL